MDDTDKKIDSYALDNLLEVAEQMFTEDLRSNLKKYLKIKFDISLNEIIVEILFDNEVITKDVVEIKT